MNERVLKKMLAKGVITLEEYQSKAVTRGRYDMYVAGVEILSGVAKNPADQKKAYEDKLETIADPKEVKFIKAQLKKLEKVLSKEHYTKKSQLKIKFKDTKAKSQREEVIRHLEDEGAITSWEAFMEYGITRLSAIIYILRHEEGMDIETETVTKKNRYNNPVSFAKYHYKKDVA